MRLFVIRCSLFVICAALLGAGCATSRVVEDSRSPEIVIDQFGSITFHGKRVTADKIAPAVKSAGIPKTEKIKVLVPEQRDHALMRTVADNLRAAGYGTVFVTNKKASIDIPASAH